MSHNHLQQKSPTAKAGAIYAVSSVSPHLPSKEVPNQFQQCTLLVRDSTSAALTILINPEEY